MRTYHESAESSKLQGRPYFLGADLRYLGGKIDGYVAVCKMAKKFPAVARKAARDGTAARYRGAAPFDYPVGETREPGEVAQ